jgi:hypothetical protein
MPNDKMYFTMESFFEELPNYFGHKVQFLTERMFNYISGGNKYG